MTAKNTIILEDIMRESEHTRARKAMPRSQGPGAMQPGKVDIFMGCLVS